MAEPEPKVKLNLKKVPTWVWIAGGGGAIIVVFLILRANAAGGGTTSGGGQDVTSLFTGLQGTIDALSTKFEADLKGLSDRETADVKALQDSLASGLKGLSDRIGSLETIVPQLQAAIAKANSDIAGILSTQAQNTYQIQAQYTAINQVIQQLEAILQQQSQLPSQALQALISNSVAAARAAITYDTLHNGQSAIPGNATIDQVIAYLKNNPGYTGSLDPAIKAFLLSLVKGANGLWSLPAQNITLPGPLPIIPPYQPPKPQPTP